MKSTIEKKERYTIFTINESEFNNLHSSDLKSEIAYLIAEECHFILLNMSEVSKIDTDGVDALLTADRTAKDVGGFLIIYGVHESVYRLIKLAKLEMTLHITGSEKEALDLLIMEELERDLDLEEGN